MSEDSSQPEHSPPAWVGKVRELGITDFLGKWRGAFTDKDTGLPLGFRGAGSAAPYTIEGLAFESGYTLQVLLALFTPACFALFLLSFAWDLNGILRACSIAGLIGFGTNWVAIKMLFWPREIRPVFGQGLIPAQREQLLDKVATEVTEKLINEELIRKEIIESGLIRRLTDLTVDRLRELTRSPEFQDDIKRLLLTYVSRIIQDEEFRKTLMETAESRLEKLTGQSFREWVILKFRGAWKESFLTVMERELIVLPETMERLVNELDVVLDNLPAFVEEHNMTIDEALLRVLLAFVREIDVRAIVLKQLATVTSLQLEQGFREFADDKLGFITLLGGVLGFLGGFVLIWPLWTLLILAVALGLMSIADNLLYPFMGSAYWPKKNEAPSEAQDAPPSDIEPEQAASK